VLSGPGKQTNNSDSVFFKFTFAILQLDHPHD